MRAAVLFALALTAAASGNHTWTWEVTVDVFEGTAEGFFGSGSYPALKACANDTADAYDQLKTGITDLEEKTITGMEEGLAELGTALDSLKAALDDCKASSTEIKQFVDTVENGFKHPATFIYHMGKDLVVNGKDIFTEISQAISLWKSESYRDAGIQIGKALNLLIEG